MESATSASAGPDAPAQARRAGRPGRLVGAGEDEPGDGRDEDQPDGPARVHDGGHEDGEDGEDRVQHTEDAAAAGRGGRQDEGVGEPVTREAARHCGREDVPGAERQDADEELQDE
ncbi:hypothetical protein, partial [Streptomyces sp. NPDC058434]